MGIRRNSRRLAGERIASGQDPASSADRHDEPSAYYIAILRSACASRIDQMLGTRLARAGYRVATLRVLE